MAVSNSSGAACPELEQLAAYIDGTLDHADRVYVEAHLAQCDLCLEIVAETAAAVVAHTEVARSGSAADNPTLLQFTPARRWPLLRRLLVGGAAAAAAAALAVVLVRPWQSAVEPANPARLTDLRLVATMERSSPGRLYGFAHAPFDFPTRSAQTRPAENLQVLEAARRIQLEVIRSPLPDNQHAWGVAQILIREWDGAITTLESIAKDRPRDPSLLNDLAVAYIGRGTSEAKLDDFTTALDLADRALQADPASNEALFNRAVALDALGRRADAEVVYRSILQRDGTPWRQEVERRLATPSRTP